MAGAHLGVFDRVFGGLLVVLRAVPVHAHLRGGDEFSPSGPTEIYIYLELY